MKVFVIVAFLAAIVATGQSSPAPKVVDWMAVASKASEMEDTINNAGRDIMAMACNENAAVCTNMQMKMDMVKMEVSAVMDWANQAIAAQTMTEAQAKVMVGELRGVMGRMQGMIQGDIAMLMPVTAAQCRAMIDAMYVAVAMEAREMYALLRQ